MNPRLTALAAGLVLAAVAAVYFLGRSPSPEATPEPPAADAADAPVALPPATTRPEDLEAESIEAMRQRVADLELALQTATDMRNEAEAALDASEREVEELEAYVEEMEASGKDPVDFADETMALFQPAFFRFEDASAAYERAELLEQAARDELAKARAELAALEADGAGR